MQFILRTTECTLLMAGCNRHHVQLQFLWNERPVQPKLPKGQCSPHNGPQFIAALSGAHNARLRQPKATHGHMLGKGGWQQCHRRATRRQPYAQH